MILTIEYIKQIIADFFSQKPVNKVWLFGSYARGDADENSDIDVLVDIELIKGIGSDYFKWNSQLAKMLNKKVDIVSLGDENIYIKPLIEKDKLVLYERNHRG